MESLITISQPMECSFDLRQWPSPHLTRPVSFAPFYASTRLTRTPYYRLDSDPLGLNRASFTLTSAKCAMAAELEDVLDELCARFLVNLPPEEISNKSRLGFQLEKAFWFYDDFSRPEQPSLPKLTLKSFAQRLLQRCPRDLLLPALGQSTNYAKFVAEFYQYKSMVPTCGAIILNEDLTKCLMVRGWSAKSTWGFPKGKINKDEPPSHCAIREVFEETGFDIASHLKEDAFIQIEQQTGANVNNNGVVGRNPIRLYIIAGIPEATTYFAPQTRREIGDIAWHPIRDLRYDRQASSIRYFNVMPFVGPLKAWIRKQQSPQSQAPTTNVKRQKDRKKTRVAIDELDDPLEAPGPTQVHPNDVDPLYLQLTERINKLMLPLSTFSVDVSSLVNTLSRHFPEI